jgi:CubicO group peptidase (beta-lactamase class C family)
MKKRLYYILIVVSVWCISCQKTLEKATNETVSPETNKGTATYLVDTLNLEPTDPLVSKIMAGYPQAADKQVTQNNWLIYPNNRWSFRHVRDLFPTSVSRRSGNISELPYGQKKSWDTLSFTDKNNNRLTMLQYFKQENVDGFMVLKDGKVLYEKYMGSFTPNDDHLWMSTTKSLTGLVAEMLVEKGVLDTEKTAQDYLPALKGTVYGNAKLKHLLNMELNIKETVSTKAASLPAESFTGPYLDLLIDSKGVTQAGENGKLYFYTNSDPQTIGAVMTAVTGKSWSHLVEEMIWSKLGTERDGCVIVDKHAQAMSAGGYNSTMRDVARFLEMVRNYGYYNGQQIVPRSVIEKLMKLHDNVELFGKGNVGPKRKGMSYKDYWYQVNDGDKSLELIGIFGQHHHVNPKKGITIIQLSTNKMPGGDGIDYGKVVERITNELSK